MQTTCEALDASAFIYNQDGILAVNKPAGIATRGDSRYPVGLMEKLVAQTGQNFYPVHRLDVVTTGVLIFGVNSKVRNALCDQFFNRQVEKTYWAVVEGKVPQLEWENSAPVDKKPAHTSFKSLKEFSGPKGRPFTLVEAKPTTGRKHQIRKHLAGEGHPIAGDYDHGAHRKLGLIERPLLHALQLICINPQTAAPLLLEAPLPEDFSAFLPN